MTPNYIVRDFKNDDYPQVVSLWNELTLNDPKRGDSLEVIHKTLKKEGTLLILEELPKNIIVGTSWISNDGRRLYLHHFGIKKQYQGKKLSYALLNASLSFAKSKQMQIKLEVHEQNKIAMHLYEKVGFNYLCDFKVLILRNTNNITLL